MKSRAEFETLIVNDLPAEEVVAILVEHARRLPASDVFLLTNQEDVTILVRHLGMIRPLTVMPLDQGRRCIGHIKATAGMDVAERRRPLDGRWIYQPEEGPQIDIRINTIPTLYGEDCALRLLGRNPNLQTIDQLGMIRQEYNDLLAMLNSPSGLILVTGPTGSGKTTTLYACLRYLNTGERKINTIEDPIEYEITGIRQSQIHEKIELGYPELLRSVLRQAPDVIMVGEIRDPATAATAVHAANSGHLVLATLHAPLAAGAIQSMLSRGVQPHFLAGCLLGVVAQRLIRTLCTECRTAIPLGSMLETFDDVKRWLEPGMGETLYAASGCPKCFMTGYADRTGVFEVMKVGKELREIIAAGRPTSEVRQKALEQGMIELRHGAMLRVAQGRTTVEEVIRAVPAEYLGLED